MAVSKNFIQREIIERFQKYAITMFQFLLAFLLIFEVVGAEKKEIATHTKVSKKERPPAGNRWPREGEAFIGGFLRTTYPPQDLFAVASCTFPAGRDTDPQPGASLPVSGDVLLS